MRTFYKLLDLVLGRGPVGRWLAHRRQSMFAKLNLAIRSLLKTLSFKNLLKSFLRRFKVVTPNLRASFDQTSFSTGFRRFSTGSHLKVGYQNRLEALK